MEELPTYPGARLTSRRSSPYYAGESPWSPVRGYTTLAYFDLPPAASPNEVAAFYERALVSEWTLVQKQGEDPPFTAGPILNFRRGTAFVSVNLESYRGGILEIGVDHRVGR